MSSKSNDAIVVSANKNKTSCVKIEINKIPPATSPTPGLSVTFMESIFILGYETIGFGKKYVFGKFSY